MKSDVVPFVAPFFIFALFLTGESYFPGQHYLLYPIVTLLVAAAIFYFWRRLPTLVPSSVIGSIIVGVVAIVLWTGLDPWAMKIYQVLGNFYNSAVSAVGLTSWRTVVQELHPAGLNPFTIYPAAEAWVLFAFRVAGIAICVPIMEELFWRGFLMRWLIKEDFTAVPIGAYQPFSFWITTAFFAMVHGSEWPLAVVVGILYGAWFVRTKSLGNIMVAHGVTNLLLAFYCLGSGDWHFLCVAPSAPVAK
jgi:membrane protease YdiL (CAAX protease family)